MNTPIKYVRITTAFGRVRTKAFCVDGRLAVTGLVTDCGGEIFHSSTKFTISHIATGYAAASGIAPLAHAKKIMQRLAKLPIPWDSRDVKKIGASAKKLSNEDKMALSLLRSGVLPKVRAKKAVKA